MKKIKVSKPTTIYAFKYHCSRTEKQHTCTTDNITELTNIFSEMQEDQLIKRKLPVEIIEYSSTGIRSLYLPSLTQEPHPFSTEFIDMSGII
jgi:hypothetical protein